MKFKIKYFLLLFFTLSLSSCEVYKNYQQAVYPGDYFSRSISYAKCQQVEKDHFKYELPEGNVELHLMYEKPYILDCRGNKTVKMELAGLIYNSRIDNSLRYLIRFGMTYDQIKRILGPNGEKWGGITGNMQVWEMADGRYLAIIPSTLEMPEGMSFYHILSENQKFESAVKLLGLGKTETLEN